MRLIRENVGSFKFLVHVILLGVRSNCFPSDYNKSGSPVFSHLSGIHPLPILEVQSSQERRAKENQIKRSGSRFLNRVDWVFKSSPCFFDNKLWTLFDFLINASNVLAQNSNTDQLYSTKKQDDDHNCRIAHWKR